MDLQVIAESLESIVAECEASKDKSANRLLPMLDEIAFMFHANGEFELAEKFYLKALNAREAIHGFTSTESIATYHNLGLINRVRKKFEDAEFFYQRALELTRRDNPENAGEPDSIGNTGIQNNQKNSFAFATRCNYLAGLYFAWGNYDKARAYLDNSLEIYRELMGEDHLYVGYCLIALALIEFKDGHKDKATFCLDVADSIVNPAIMLELSISAVTLPALIASLALIYARQNRFDEAEIMFRYALIQEARDIWPTHPSVGEELKKLALLYKAKGRDKASQFLFSESERIGKKIDLLEEPELQKVLARMVSENEQFVSDHSQRTTIMAILKEALENV